MARWTTGLILFLLLAACAGESTTEPPPPPPPDTGAPTVNVVFPKGPSIDRDGDGLADIELAWSDSGGLVDKWGVVGRNARGYDGPATPETNILHAWEVTRLDTLGVALHETVANLLHRGDNEIRFTVPDTAGNTTTVTVAIHAPPGAIHKVLAGRRWSDVEEIVVCRENPRAYAWDGLGLMEIDLSAVEVDTTYLDLAASVSPSRMLCIAGDPGIWSTSYQYVRTFDRYIHAWSEPLWTTRPTDGVALSKADPNLLYVGERAPGDVGIVDRALRERTGSIGLPPSPEPFEAIPDLEVLSGDVKIYVPRYYEGGLIVANPTTGAILGRIDFDAASSGYGHVWDMALSPDESRLYVSVPEGDPPGIWEIDTATDEVQRVMDMSGWPSRDIALSPDGLRLFVLTYADFTSPSQHFLIDPVNWKALQGFEEFREPGELVLNRAVAFDPTGKLVLVGRNEDIVVYLSRE